MQKEGEYYIAAHGGAGGRGNHYYLSNEERAPVMAEYGGKAEERELQLELEIMAHAGLVCVYLYDSCWTGMCILVCLMLDWYVYSNITGSLVVKHSICIWNVQVRFPAKSNQRLLKLKLPSQMLNI